VGGESSRGPRGVRGRTNVVGDDSPVGEAPCGGDEVLSVGKVVGLVRGEVVRVPDVELRVPNTNSTGGMGMEVAQAISCARAAEETEPEGEDSEEEVSRGGEDALCSPPRHASC